MASIHVSAGQNKQDLTYENGISGKQKSKPTSERCMFTNCTSKSLSVTLFSTVQNRTE